MNNNGTSPIELDQMTKDQLVDALLLQSNKISSSLHVCFEKSIVGVDEIIKILSCRNAGETFVSAAHRLKLLQDDDIKRIENDLMEQLQSFSHILHEPTQTNQEAHVSNTEVPTNPPTQDLGGPHFSFPQVSGETKKQYLDFFSKNIKQSLEDGFNKFTESSSDLENELLNIEEILQQLTAAANFARMEVSYYLAEKLTLLIEGMTSHAIPFDKNKDLLKSFCLTALDVLWELHRFIDLSGEEVEFWQNDVSRANYNKIIRSLESFLGGNS